jgi:hypothetical protein
LKGLSFLNTYKFAIRGQRYRWLKIMLQRRSFFVREEVKETMEKMVYFNFVLPTNVEIELCQKKEDEDWMDERSSLSRSNRVK